MNGKGKAPEKGRNLPKFREGYAAINWRKKPCTTRTSRKKMNTKIRSFNYRTGANP